MEREAKRIAIPSAPAPGVVRAYHNAVVALVRALLADALGRRRAGDDQGERRAAVDGAARAMQALRASAGHPFDALCEALAIDERARLGLLVAAAPYLDGTIRDAIRAYRERGVVDVTLICDLLGLTLEQATVVRQLGPGSPLVEAGLIEHQRPGMAHTPSPLELEVVPSPRLLGILAGELVFDPRLAEWARLHRCAPGDADGVIAAADRDRWFALMRGALGRSGPILVTGAHGVGKTRLCSAFAATEGRSFIVEAEAVLLPRGPRELAMALAALVREARVTGALLVVRNVEAALAAAGAATWRAAVLRCGGPILLTSEQDQLPELRPVIVLSVPVDHPDAHVRADAWRLELAADGHTLAEADIARLAASYPLPRSAVVNAVALACDLALTDGRDVSADDLETAARSQIESQLGRYAQVISSRGKLADLVLPPELAESIHELIQAVRARPTVMEGWGLARRLTTGKGIAAMFNGPPGTGKTFTAGVIASELGLPLFRIDVSKIVDRFVGETEKNLARVFEEAGATHAVLLFDEADSLFGKRLSAKDASDRYANMQINMLLNLIEDHDGFVILTTNLKSQMDTAFLRRIAFKITFEAPGADERLALWQKLLPPDAPLADDVDIKTLARDYELSGGEIKNAVLRAALTCGIL